MKTQKEVMAPGRTSQHPGVGGMLGTVSHTGVDGLLNTVSTRQSVISEYTQPVISAAAIDEALLDAQKDTSKQMGNQKSSLSRFQMNNKIGGVVLSQKKASDDINTNSGY